MIEERTLNSWFVEEFFPIATSDLDAMRNVAPSIVLSCFGRSRMR